MMLRASLQKRGCRLEPKGVQSVNSFVQVGLHGHNDCRWIGQTQPIIVTCMERGKPVSLPLFEGGKQAARQAYTGCGYRNVEKANAVL